MSPDPSEPAFDWGESDDALVLGDDQKKPKTESAAVSSNNPVILGVFGGLYAVWSVAWVLGVVASPPQQASSVVDAVMFQFGEFLGMVASPLWFGVVWWLSSESSRLARGALLIAGLVILFPFPLVLPLLV
jgi:hypothetical protein